MEERTYCTGCRSYRFKAAEQLCCHCQRGVEVNAEPTVTHVTDSQPLTYDDPALERAHRERLTIIATQHAGVFMVSSGISRHMFYKTTLTACTCQAGQFGRQCKHKALVSEAVNVKAAA